MILKYQSTHSIYALCSYVLREGKHEKKAEETQPKVVAKNLIEGNVTSTKTAKLLELQNLKRIKKRGPATYFHIIMAHKKSDLRDGKTEQLIFKRTIEKIKEVLDIKEVPFIAVRHQDKLDTIDYHIIAPTTYDNGKAISNSHLGYKLSNIAYEVSQEYELSCGKYIPTHEENKELIAMKAHVESKGLKFNRNKAINYLLERKEKKVADKGQRINFVFAKSDEKVGKDPITKNEDTSLPTLQATQDIEQHLEEKLVEWQRVEVQEQDIKPKKKYNQFICRPKKRGRGL